MDGSGACENCGAMLQGAFCHECGQGVERSPDELVPFLKSQFAAITSYESGALRTLGGILVRPGRVTREYLAGHRAAYAAPIQFYLWTAAAFFLVNTYTPMVDINARMVVEFHLSSVSMFRALPQDVADSLQRSELSADLLAARLNSKASTYLPILFLGMVVVFSGWLKLLFRQRLFSVHATFALHWSSFYLILEVPLKNRCNFSPV